jgi:hypothetical protein
MEAAAVATCAPALRIAENCAALIREPVPYPVQVAYFLSTLAWGLVIAAALWRAGQCGDFTDYAAAVLFPVIYVVASAFIKCRPKAYAV